jgi:hypothetical protein
MKSFLYSVSAFRGVFPLLFGLQEIERGRFGYSQAVGHIVKDILGLLGFGKAERVSADADDVLGVDVKPAEGIGAKRKGAYLGTGDFGDGYLYVDIRANDG